MNLHKSKIDWCTHTWNPVTGCLHGCDYCYAKRFIARFEPHACEMVLPEPLEFLPKGSGCFIIDEPSKLYDENVNYLRSTPYPKGFAPTFHGYAMDYPTKRRIPSRVFVKQHGRPFRRVGAGRVDLRGVFRVLEGAAAHLPVPHEKPAAIPGACGCRKAATGR